MSTLRAGTLRDRITIQRKTGGVNEWDEPLPDGWEEHAKVWARVEHLSGLAAIKADADTSIVKASMRIRWRTDVNAGMRVLFSGKTYDIDAVQPGATREYVDLVCKLVT
ncbi:MAG: phage head closure protein [Ottowia sp.]|uniref:phage head closure protein n=1 Tax=Ottowia sp. TaxID=1898956 RepID=UPI003C77F8F3